MRIYIAAPWATREVVPAVAIALESLGAVITHKWWIVEDKYPTEFSSPESIAYMREQALADVEGVRNADLVVVLNTSKSEGKAVEQGIALAMKKPIIAVGERGVVSNNVFHYLANYYWVPDIEAMLDVIRMFNWAVEVG